MSPAPILRIRYPHRRALLAAARAEGSVLSLFVLGQPQHSIGSTLELEISLDDSPLRFSVAGTVRARFESQLARQEPGLAVVFQGDAKKPVAEMVAICAGRALEDGTALDSREQVNVSCLLEFPRNTLRGVIRDFSNTGAFIGIAEQLDTTPGVEVTVKLDLLFGRWGGHPLKARVVWSGRKYGVHGFGVRFVDAPNVVRERLKKHLTR